MKEVDAFALHHKKDFSHEKQQATKEIHQLSAEILELKKNIKYLEQQKVDNEERQRKVVELKGKCTVLITTNHELNNEYEKFKKQLKEINHSINMLKSDPQSKAALAKANSDLEAAKEERMYLVDYTASLKIHQESLLQKQILTRKKSGFDYHVVPTSK